MPAKTRGETKAVNGSSEISTSDANDAFALFSYKSQKQNTKIDNSGNKSSYPVKYADNNSNYNLVPRRKDGDTPNRGDDKDKANSSVKAEFGDASASPSSDALPLVGLLRPIPEPKKLAAVLVSLGASAEFAAKSGVELVQFLASQEFTPPPEGPDVPPLLYKDRPKGMTPPEFMLEYYSEWLGRLTRRKFRDLDPVGSQSLYDWERRHPKDPKLEGVKLLSHSEFLEKSRAAMHPALEEGKREYLRKRRAIERTMK